MNEHEDKPEPPMELVKNLKYTVKVPGKIRAIQGRDTVVVKIPPDVVDSPHLQEWLHMMALTAIHRSEDSPYELVNEEWNVSSDSAEVAQWVPEHDCPGCWAGIKQARQAVNEGSTVATCVIHYRVYKGNEVVTGSAVEGWKSDEELKKMLAKQMHDNPEPKIGVNTDPVIARKIAEQVEGVTYVANEEGVPVFALESVDDLPTVLEQIGRIFNNLGKDEQESE